MPEGADSPGTAEGKGDPSPSPKRALIVGAGIGGLSAALFLARAGWSVTLAEREPLLNEVGAGLQLSPNVTRLLAPLGLLDDLEGIAVKPGALRIWNGTRGEPLSRAPLGKSAMARYGAPFLVVHRGDLQTALARRAKAQAAIDLRLGLAVESISESEDTVTARFRLADGGEETHAADILVAADGVWSKSRGLLGMPSATRYSGKTAWRSLVPREQAPLFAREAEVNLWLGPRGHLVHYPVCGGREINIVAIIEDSWREENWSAPGDPVQIEARFLGWHRKARDLVGSAETWKRWALCDRPADARWSSRRTTLLGDAAHPMMPFLAQGAGQAIEDGAALAALLRDAQTPDGIAAALNAYQAIRLPRSARVQSEARRQALIYHLEGIPARLRDAALGLLPAGVLLKRYSWLFDHDASAPAR